jgi:hypothetical protein
MATNNEIATALETLAEAAESDVATHDLQTLADALSASADSEAGSSSTAEATPRADSDGAEDDTGPFAQEYVYAAGGVKKNGDDAGVLEVVADFGGHAILAPVNTRAAQQIMDSWACSVRGHDFEPDGFDRTLDELYREKMDL